MMGEVSAARWVLCAPDREAVAARLFECVAVEEDGELRLTPRVGGGGERERPREVVERGPRAVEELADQQPPLRSGLLADTGLPDVFGLFDVRFVDDRMRVATRVAGRHGCERVELELRLIAFEPHPFEGVHPADATTTEATR